MSLVKEYVCPGCKRDAREIGCDLEGDEVTGNTVPVMALHLIDDGSSDQLACDGYGCSPILKEVRRRVSVYVVGIPESGGCWISMGHYYNDWNVAKKECDLLNGNDPYCQVFTLEAQDNRYFDSMVRSRQRDGRDISRKG